jgi:UDP-N-acetylglucosamine/UDP-N-acetylgalactosamine diphosphorylase
MTAPPEELRRRLQQYHQEHVLAFWSQLSEAEQRELVQQLQALDWELLQRLYDQRERPWPVPPRDQLQPPPVVRLEAQDPSLRTEGEAALRQGEVAVLVVAGGQGSRLGFEHPKGMFPIGPVSGKSLFQLHAEKVLALERRYQHPLPFLILTSPATQEETVAFFRQHDYFGLDPAQVYFFCQGTMPALDAATGRLLLEAPGRLFLSPNGHGGVLPALRDSGLLARLRTQGIQQIFYFQVDNPLVQVAEPAFLGLHRRARAELSLKVIAKQSPEDRLGNVVVVAGRCHIIEYSDLPEDLARATDAAGQLRFWAGSPAIHILECDFLDRLIRENLHLPYHIARKKVPYLDETGRRVEPTQPNALKFEMFIFDIFPQATRWCVVEADRRWEFAPLKNAEGPDSPATVRQALSDLAGDWLERAGVAVPRRPDGTVAVPLEISPLFALDAAELAAKVDRKLRLQGPTYLA